MIRAYADGRLFGHQNSAAPRVLALHGWRRDHRDFLPALGDLDLIALDLAGFGRSPVPATSGHGGVWGAAEYAEAVRPVLDLMTQPVVIVGHSFGGRVAVHLAARWPDAVGGLVLTGVPLLHREGRSAAPPLAFRVARWLHHRRLVPDQIMESLRYRHGSADYRAAHGAMREIFVKVVNESYETQLRELRCPVHLLWGEEDDQVPPEVASRAETLIPDARLTIAGGVGHLLPIESPQTLRAAVEAQLVLAGRRPTA